MKLKWNQTTFQPLAFLSGIIVDRKKRKTESYSVFLRVESTNDFSFFLNHIVYNVNMKANRKGTARINVN